MLPQFIADATVSTLQTIYRQKTQVFPHCFVVLSQCYVLSCVYMLYLFFWNDHMIWPDTCILCREQRMWYNRENREEQHFEFSQSCLGGCTDCLVPDIFHMIRSHTPNPLQSPPPHTHLLPLSFSIFHSPMQLPWGSWEKPVRQCCCFGLQRNEPSVFWHWIPESQSWLCTAHSSISEETEQRRS